MINGRCQHGSCPDNPQRRTPGHRVSAGAPHHVRPAASVTYPTGMRRGRG